MSVAGAAGPVRFGVFTFDRSSQELRKGGTRVRVPGQSLAILAMLLERPGELVTRTEIQARLWPHGTVVQFEQSLNSAVRRLRDAVSDTAGTPRFVETIPRKGYRFVGTLETAEDERAELTPGTVISHYSILAPAGCGAMGVVYKAEDTTLGRMVALKFLPEELAAHEPALDRFRREARMIGALNHPGICTIYELGAASGHLFLAMEFLDGESLRERTARGSVPEQEVLGIALQAATALEAAHAQGVVHRDIKPDNLFLTRQGTVKLMDFGLAKLIEEEGGTAPQSAVTGTSGYMSPEQARGEALDQRTDLYSLGVVLCEMLGGRPGEPPDLPAPVSPAMGSIVRRCLEKEPDRRFQSAAELALALQSSSPSLPSAEGPQGRNWLKWAVIAGCIVAVTGAALLWLTRPLLPPRVTSTVQITNDGRQKWYPLVTDGPRVFFNSGGNGFVTQVSQVSVKGGESAALPLPVKDAQLVDISPNRTELLLCRGWFVTCELWVAPLLGGSARRLGDLVATNVAAAWSPDGQQVAYARGGELHLARSDGTEVRKVATLPGDLYWLRWSPDGSRVRFSLQPLEGGVYSLWEARIDGNRAYPLLAGWKPSSYSCCGNWTPDGKYFVFQTDMNLWALREKVGLFQRAERGPFQLTNGPLPVAWPVPSTDGKRLFVNGRQSRNEFLRYDLKSGQRVPAFAGISGTQLEFSRDGKWVAYVSAPDESLWRSAADGSQRLQFTSHSLQASTPHWSPDGKRIAFSGAREGGGGRIYAVSVDGSGLKQVTNGEGGKGGDVDPSWSADGASLAFGCVACALSVSAGAASIQVVDLRTGHVSALPGSEGMWSPRWSPNGRFIAGLSASGWKVVLYDVETRKQSEISNLVSGWLSWSPDGESLFYETFDHDASWWRVRMRDRKTERVAALKNMQVGKWFAPAPNNSLITTRSVGTDEIYALDWEAP
jgi:Tol biopolymer transport system component/DNA-binding winged helix-turn-helix (wHTH) protein